MPDPSTYNGWLGQVVTSGETGGDVLTVSPGGTITFEARQGGLQTSPFLEAVYGAAGAAADTVGGNDINNAGIPDLEGQTRDYADWTERVGNYSPWNDVFSVQEQETQLVVDVPFENRYLFLPHALGFAWAQGGRLRRINPLQHPYYTWMRVARVANSGVRFQGSRVAVSSTGVATGASASPKTAARYKLARYTLGFANYPWSFYEDSEIPTAADEWWRNTYFELEPITQMLTAEGGNSVLRFAYNSTGTGGPPKAAAFRASFGTPVSMIRYTLHWKWVPWDYVCKGLIPVNLIASAQKVNMLPMFDDFAPGTLLCETPKITRYAAPIRYTRSVVYFCDIAISFLHFDPPRGIDAGPGSTIRGHNLVPWRENNLWYPAVRTPTSVPALIPPPAGNNQLFPYSDFSAMFTQPV